ncbi:hypothetical protein H6F90_07165 [Trichocoleus sp. FACHB-591]|uniref:hypothetical protein n=1 Tax=Trichocoleus sp. FACHB-591 TaxID=2692872 RepID=UPI0016860E92|nr:hypothetical protein [Trichocoleus sp. FACHB-591]MBD2094934.1 hypothetical protein [Trichocoleus sp. FACHB-591]
MVLLSFKTLGATKHNSPLYSECLVPHPFDLPKLIDQTHRCEKLARSPSQSRQATIVFTDVLSPNPEANPEGEPLYKLLGEIAS